MKKSMITVAALAALSSNAFAQSSVTLYGIVDVSAGSVKDTLWDGNKKARNTITTRQSVVNSAALNTNRWGLRGSEDLGGNLKANFQLEQGFRIDDGTAAEAGSQFDRHAWVGLSGDFGELRLGRTYSTYDQFRGAVNQLANTNFAATADVWKAAGGDYTFNLKNHIQYLSPVVKGVSAGLSYALGENKNDVGNVGFGSTDTVALYLRYASGPVLAGYAYQKEDQKLGVKATTYQLLGGSYSIGTVQVQAAYNWVNDQDGKEKEYQVGVSAPLGPITLYAGYANAKADNNAGVTLTKVSGASLLGTYALSKRSNLYAGLKRVDETGTAGEKQHVVLGVRHTF